jgi:hypothetical protein
LKIDSFKNVGYKSGVYVGLVKEKNQRPKISCYCPFKETNRQKYTYRETRKPISEITPSFKLCLTIPYIMQQTCKLNIQISLEIWKPKSKIILLINQDIDGKPQAKKMTLSL